MLLVRSMLGTLDDPAFAGRRVERVFVGWADASKRRLRCATEAGTDLAIDVARGSYLADGTVLHDDGARVIAVARPVEPALVISLDTSLPPPTIVEHAARVGHAFGNQHVPLDLKGSEIRVPLTTSEQIARETVAGIGLEGAQVSVETVALGAHEPLTAGHSHGHGHS